MFARYCRFWVACGICIVFACFSDKLLAQSYTWTGNGTSLSWGDPGNWSGGQIPASNGVDSIIFPASASTLAAVQDAASINIGSIDFQGMGYNVTGQPIELSHGGISDDVPGTNNISNSLVLGNPIGIATAGNLTLSGPISQANGVTGAGILASGSGTLTLSGTNSQINNLEATCNSLVLNGGSLALTSTSLAGTAGEALAVGFGTASSLTVQSGATLDTSQGSTAVGIAGVEGDDTQSAVMTVTGAGTKWLMPAELDIGQVAFNPSFVGDGKLIFDHGAVGSGGLQLFVGKFAQGSLTIQGGASVTGFNSTVGAGGLGCSATVTGAGSNWMSTGTLEIGGSFLSNLYGVNTSVIVSNGGSIEAGTTVFTAFFNPSNISLTINGGTFSTGLMTNDAYQNDVPTITLTDPGGGTALTINGASGSATLNAYISGSGSILKTGGCSQTLDGIDGLTGSITVNGGTLMVYGGNVSNPLSNLQVNAGAMTIGLGTWTLAQLTVASTRGLTIESSPGGSVAVTASSTTTSGGRRHHYGRRWRNVSIRRRFTTKQCTRLCRPDTDTRH